MEKRLIPGDDKDGSTPLDDISELKPDYISTREELNNAEFANYMKAVFKYVPMFSGSRKLNFTLDLIVTVHRDMFSDVWEWAGVIRKRDLSIGVSHFRIREELQKLLDDLDLWISHKRDPVETAVYLHHRLVWIHPFANGNGRWARFIADLYLKQELNKITHWPQNELFIKSEFRNRYVSALKKADSGNFLDLIQMQRELLK